MTQPTEQDRERAARALGIVWPRRDGTIGGEWDCDRIDRVAQALADERARTLAPVIEVLHGLTEETTGTVDDFAIGMSEAKDRILRATGGSA